MDIGKQLRGGYGRTTETLLTCGCFKSMVASKGGASGVSSLRTRMRFHQQRAEEENGKLTWADGYCSTD